MFSPKVGSIAWFDQSALFFTSEENVSGIISLNHKSPGDYADGETPDPIPNSEAKPVRPMIVLRGESR